MSESEEIHPGEFRVPSADELRQLRVLSGRGQGEVAGEIGAARNTLWRWEQGERGPTIADAEKLLELYQREKEGEE